MNLEELQKNYESSERHICIHCGILDYVDYYCGGCFDCCSSISENELGLEE